MRTLLVAALVAGTLLPERSASQTLDAGRVVGRWSGSGSFFDAELRQKAGAVPFVVEIAADRSGSGRIGDAVLNDVQVKPTRNYIEMRAKLAGPLGKGAAPSKDRLVIVVTAVTDSTIEAEFHLKSNFAFDPWMQEGRVLLTRIR
jgi:hypothetical protein